MKVFFTHAVSGKQSCVKVREFSHEEIITVLRHNISRCLALCVYEVWRVIFFFATLSSSLNFILFSDGLVSINGHGSFLSSTAHS